MTTILSVLSKPALYTWHAKHGSAKALAIMDTLKEKSPNLHDLIQAEFGANYFRDGTSLAEEAADYGKQAHAIIEKILQFDPQEYEWLQKDTPEPVQKAVQSFLAWRSRTEFEVMKTESLVYSRKLKFAGTCDVIGRTKNGVTLGDWKTSKAIYPEYLLQVVAYKYAAEEMSGEHIPNAVICRFGKDGSFSDYVVPPMDHPDLFDRFIDAKRLFEWRQKQAVINY